MLVAAGMNGFAGAMGGRGIPFALAGLFSVIGIFYLMNPPFVLEPRRLLIKNPLGMTLKTYTFDSPTALEVVDGKVFLDQGGERVRLRGISRAMVHGDDWARFVQMTEGEIPVQGPIA